MFDIGKFNCRTIKDLVEGLRERFLGLKPSFDEKYKICGKMKGNNKITELILIIVCYFVFFRYCAIRVFLICFCYFVCMILVTLCNLLCMSVFRIWSLSLNRATFILLITAITLVPLITLSSHFLLSITWDIEYLLYR